MFILCFWGLGATHVLCCCELFVSSSFLQTYLGTYCAINRLVMHFIFYALTTTRKYNILLIYILKTTEINKFGRVFYTLW